MSPKLTVHVAHSDDIVQIVQNLWGRGEVEMFNYGMRNRSQIADHMLGMFNTTQEHSYCLRDDDDRIAVYGAYQIGEKSYSTWFMATDRFQEFGMQITRHLARFLKAEITKAGPDVYLELVSASEHPYAEEWFKALGFFPKKGQGLVFRTYVYKGRVKRS